MITPQPSATRNRARRLLFVTLLAGIGVAALTHMLGGHIMAMTGATIAGVTLFGVVMWRLPHLRNHFKSPYGRRRARFQRLGYSQPRVQRRQVREMRHPARGSVTVAPRRSHPLRRGFRLRLPFRRASRTACPFAGRATRRQLRRSARHTPQRPVSAQATSQRRRSPRSSATPQASRNARPPSRQRRWFTPWRGAVRQTPATARRASSQPQRRPLRRRAARPTAANHRRSQRQIGSGQPAPRRRFPWSRRIRNSQPRAHVRVPSSTWVPNTRRQPWPTGATRRRSRNRPRGLTSPPRNRSRRARRAQRRSMINRLLILLGFRAPRPHRASTAYQHAQPIHPVPAIIVGTVVPVTRPALHLPQAPKQGGPPVSNRIESVTEAVGTHIAGFRPGSRSDVEQFFGGLPGMLRELGRALDSAAGNMEDMHIHSAVIDMLRELGHVVSGTADSAEQTYAKHAAQHELWLTD